MNCIEQTTGEGFVLYHGDCVDVLRGLPDQSIHYSIFIYPLQHFLAAVCEPLHLQQQPSRYGQLPHE